MTPLMIGSTELLLIAAIALFLFGGKKLPELMRIVWDREFDSLRKELTNLCLRIKRKRSYSLRRKDNDV